MIFARSAAMAFNRYIDRDVDQLNPRSSNREIPSGIIKPKNALIFVIINCVLFILCTFFINDLCFYLSPVALLVILGYSLTKRFTFLCHLVLGLGLSLAPIGAYIAVTNEFSVISILFGFSVLFWVAGFDIIYALQDEYFDKNQNLYSIPSYFGGKRALNIAKLLHAASIIFISIACYSAITFYQQLGIFTYFGLFIFIALIIYQHSLVKYNDLSKVNIAFFTTNGFASVIFCTFFLLDYFL